MSKRPSTPFFFSSLFPLPSLTLSHHITFHLYISGIPHHPYTYLLISPILIIHTSQAHIPFFSYTYASHTYPSPSPMLYRYNSKVYFTSPIPVKHIPLLTLGSSKNSHNPIKLKSLKPALRLDFRVKLPLIFRSGNRYTFPLIENNSFNAYFLYLLLTYAHKAYIILSII